MNYSTMINKPNYKKAANMAHYTLRQHQIEDFPIDIFAMFDNHDDLEILSYQDMAKQLGISTTDIVEMCCSEDGCISYNHDTKKYIILFNDDVSIPMTRIRFTLCHEYGHYILNHLLETENGNLSRNSITEYENEKFEKEANLFARELLAPTFLVSSVEYDDSPFVSDYFYISEQMSEYLIEYVCRCKDKGWEKQLCIPYHLKGRFAKIKSEFEQHRRTYRTIIPKS